MIMKHAQQHVYCCCAGRAGEELVYGPDEMSTVNQRRLVMARRIVQKLVLTVAPCLTPQRRSSVCMQLHCCVGAVKATLRVHQHILVFLP
jgi:hypothetical protein